MFNSLMILLADAAGAAAPPAAPAPTPDAGGGLLSSGMLPMLGVGIVLFYFLFLRPMRKQDADRAALLNQIKKHDKVITHSGIYGKVISVSDKEDEIVVEVADDVRMKMVKNSILRNLTNEEAAKEAEAAKKAAKGGKPAAQPASTAVTTKEGGA